MITPFPRKLTPDQSGSTETSKNQAPEVGAAAPGQSSFAAPTTERVHNPDDVGTPPRAFHGDATTDAARGTRTSIDDDIDRAGGILGRNSDAGDATADLRREPRPGDRSSDRDAVTGPRTSGDAANVGTVLGGEPLGPGGGATHRGNPGDAGADAGDGALDATDATTVTGETDPGLDPDDQAVLGTLNGTGPGTIERAGGENRVTGALDAEDISTDEEADLGPSPTGPDAEQEGPHPGKLGRSDVPAQDFPRGTGVTNVNGPADDDTKRRSGWNQ